MRASWLPLVAAAVLLPNALRAQSAQHAEATPAAPVAPALALDTVRQALRAFVVAQEAYFADHGTYTTDIAALRATGRLGAFGTVLFNVGHAGGLGWRGSARHRAVWGKTCVTFVGAPEHYPMPATRAEQRRPAPEQEGEPVCDAP